MDYKSLSRDPNSPGTIDLRNAKAAIVACRIANRDEAGIPERLGAAAACRVAAGTSITEAWKLYWITRAESQEFAVALMRELASLEGRTDRNEDGTFTMGPLATAEHHTHNTTPRQSAHKVLAAATHPEEVAA